jgi:amino acid transporter
MTQSRLSVAISSLVRLFPTVLSAYAVVAYTAGSELNTYQVAFVNFVFIAFVFTNLGALHSMTIQVFDYGDQLISLRGGKPVQQIVGEGVRWTMFASRSLMSLGALAFMWQVRHTNAEETL